MDLAIAGERVGDAGAVAFGTDDGSGGLAGGQRPEILQRIRAIARERQGESQINLGRGIAGGNQQRLIKRLRGARVISLQIPRDAQIVQRGGIARIILHRLGCVGLQQAAADAGLRLGGFWVDPQRHLVSGNRILAAAHGVIGGGLVIQRIGIGRVRREHGLADFQRHLRVVPGNGRIRDVQYPRITGIIGRLGGGNRLGLTSRKQGCNEPCLNAKASPAHLRGSPPA